MVAGPLACTTQIPGPLELNVAPLTRAQGPLTRLYVRELLSVFVVVALTGIKLDWKSPPREAAAVPWRIAIAQLAPMTLVIAALAVGIALIDASALIWLMPVGLPLLLAIPLTVLTSQIALGTSLRDRGFLLIPEESRSPAVLRRAWMHAVRSARPALASA